MANPPHDPAPLGYALPDAKSSRRAAWMKALWWTLAVGTALCALVIALGVWAVHGFLEGMDTETLTTQEIEQLGSLTLPPSATEVRAHYRQGMDYILNVRFRIDPRDLDALIDSTSIRRPLSTTAFPLELDTFSSDKPWWNPGRPASFLAGDNDTRPTTQPSGPYQRLLIDTTDPASYLVWFVAFTT